MEHSFRAQTKGLTQFKCIQIIRDPSEPFMVLSLDHFSTRGIPGRFTGVGLGSETKLMQSIHPMLEPGTTIRYFSIFIEGGDAQPTPRNAEELASKRILSLDTSSSPFLRERISNILGIPVDRDPFVRALINDPPLLNQIWEDEQFAHIRAVQWYSDFPLVSGRNLSHIRLVTIRDIELIMRVHCISSPDTQLEDVSFFPYEEERASVLVSLFEKKS